MLRALSAALPRSQRPCRRLCLSSSPSRISLWMEGAEMVRRQALFLGDSELQQLLHIFRIVQSPISELCFDQNSSTEQSVSHEKVWSLVFSQLLPKLPCQLNVSHLMFCNGALDPMDTSPCSTNHLDGIHDDNTYTVPKICKSTKPGRRASPEAIKMWKENGFTSLIIASIELDTWSIVQELLPLLSNSAPFAIYHQYLHFSKHRSLLRLIKLEAPH
ncbi:uncharacterized protein LOC131219610 isoform X1 [Magnolia sinica]|uniref:uncharacterized protein LOC131219610 isoform X1 n=1 Tax=Magnolia sinica TaxID=86752 RepID=UPI00265B4258|nr:uncharacterized protein LOC131219610 isoform X1 [Magnolia sinica]XP_058070840.1 uncharacterized protein LOC131219610 isoform X1 [Magnolia sinica]XP_058070841.1 uncharacterized protein LOC131219610 isoform X1 [Magnolia sinica]XP_058070842.1 uncharacterized protein LOC131219610 isoform X1 [Magnolia sinica]